MTPARLPAYVRTGDGETLLSNDARAGSEIVELRWFERGEVKQMLARTEAKSTSEEPPLPAPMTLGFQLARRWAVRPNEQ